MKHDTVQINLVLPKTLLQQIDNKRKANLGFISRNTFLIQILDRYVNPEKAA